MSVNEVYDVDFEYGRYEDIWGGAEDITSMV